MMTLSRWSFKHPGTAVFSSVTFRFFDNKTAGMETFSSAAIVLPDDAVSDTLSDRIE
jgi:hypothetical protein